ncbi:MAG TPA: hypothetical protein VGL72_26790 [Bryobacteraceae bacterium]|jgi:hypothetical protein
MLLSVSPVFLMAMKEWRDGELIAVDIKDFETGKHHLDHRYLCAIQEGDMIYVVEYEKPVKSAVHDRVKFAIVKDSLILLDSDRKERSAKIEKRERAAQ